MSMRIRKPILHYCRVQRNLTFILSLKFSTTTILADRKFSPSKATLKGKPFHVHEKKGIPEKNFQILHIQVTLK